MAVELYRQYVPEMIRLYKSGKDVWNISKILGIHHQTINDYLRKEGILPPKQRKRTAAKFTVQDAQDLRVSLKAGDYIECMTEEYSQEDDRLIIPVKRKLRITGIYRHGVTVENTGKDLRYLLIPYEDILLAGQQKGA